MPSSEAYKSNPTGYLTALNISTTAVYISIDIFSEEQAISFRASDKEMIKHGNSKKSEEMVLYPDGTKVYFETLKTPYFDNQGNLLGLIGISRDITERKNKEEEITYLTYHDNLTGVYNRRFFAEKVAQLNDRVYRKAISKEKAKAEILKNAGTQFDPEIAELFVNKVLTD